MKGTHIFIESQPRRCVIIYVLFIVLLLAVDNKDAYAVTSAQLEKYVQQALLHVSYEVNDAPMQGSGIVVRIGRLGPKFLLTNYHVVEQAIQNDIPVKFRSHGKNDVKGVASEPSGWHHHADLAAYSLPVSMKELRGLRLSYEILGRGARVGTYGYPLGNFSKNVGEIQERRVLLVRLGSEAAGTGYVTKYKFDNKVNLGSSGGMLVNRKAHLMGIVTHAIFDTDRYGGRVSIGGLATPSDIIISLIKKAMRSGWEPDSLLSNELQNRRIDLATATPEELAGRIATVDIRQQRKILLELYKRPGKESTMGLVQAMDQLSGQQKKDAELLLVRRLGNMMPDTLARYLKKNNVTLCCSAIKAAKIMEEREVAPELVELLGHNNDEIVQLADEALKEIYEQDFGDVVNVTDLKRFAIKKKWKRWIDQQE